MYVSSKLILFVTIIFHCQLLGRPLEARILFMCMAMLNNVQFTMTQLMPRLISLGVESLVSLTRIRDFLLAEELRPSIENSHIGTISIMDLGDDGDGDDNEANKSQHHNLLNNTSDPSGDDFKVSILCKNLISICPGSYTTSTDIKSNDISIARKLIHGITFKCESPDLVVLCGQVGSGKSSLLLALLSELQITRGHAEIRGSLGFASQTAWIFGATIRENILFGQKFDKQRYWRVIEACALKKDLELMEFADFTYIHEDSLSGGQRARVNLARCIYRECDIYLLDDPFSAIDRRVADHIFEKVIKDFLSQKLILMATHQLSLLKYANKILLLDQGKQLAFCSFDELKEKIAKNQFDVATDQDILEQIPFLKKLSDSIRSEKSKFTRGPAANELYLSPNGTTPKKLEQNVPATLRIDGYGLTDQDGGDKRAVPLFNSSHQPDSERQVIEANEHYRTRCDQPKKNDEKSEMSQTTEDNNQLISGKSREFGLNTKRNEPASEEGSSWANKMSCTEAWCKYYTQTSRTRLFLIISTFLMTQTLFSTLDIYLTVWSLVEQNKSLLLDEIAKSNHHQHHQMGITNYPNQSRVTSSSTGIVSGLTILYDNSENISLRSTLKRYENRSSIDGDHFRYSVAGRSDEMSISESQMDISPQLPDNKASNQFLFSELMASSSRFVPMVNLFKLSRPVGDGHRILTTTDHREEKNETNIYNWNSTYLTKKDSDQSATLPAIKFMGLLMANDENILDVSIVSPNVNRIYRPLYWLVNNFSSTQHVLTYLILLILLFLSSALTNVLSLTSSNKSARILYRKLTDSALFAKLSFFDQNPISRFINRATRDIGIIDEAIPSNANQAYEALLKTAATFLIVALVNVNLALPSLIILFIFLIFHMIHVKPTRDIQRLEGISRSPIISHISTTLNGLHTIRTSKSEHYLSQLFMRHQDSHTSIFLFYLGCDRAFSVVLDCLNALYISLIAIWVSLVSDLSGPSAGLVITSAMLLSGLTQHGFMKLTETESLMTSVERVIEYCCLPQEEEDRNNKNYIRSQARQQLTGGANLMVNGFPDNILTNLDKSCNGKNTGYIGKWPTRGKIEYKQVYFYYERDVDRKEDSEEGKQNGEYSLKPVLKNINFKLNGGEKIGLIGRTGAGKSSIIATLFRLYDFNGEISIDDVDIKQIDLHTLRTSIGIIPQQSKLFTGSIRENLDPFGRYDDSEIWLALDKSNLRKVISSLPGKLDFSIIGDDGSNCLFSSGQKQLICLARILLRQSKIVVLDEATANVDPTTDAIIQATIRREFKNSTVITIAHRIETILDCDRIMILDSGQMVEFDAPDRLVAKGNNYFASLISKQ